MHRPPKVHPTKNLDAKRRFVVSAAKVDGNEWRVANAMTKPSGQVCQAEARAMFWRSREHYPGSVEFVDVMS